MKRVRSLALVFRWPVIGLLALGTVVLGLIGFLDQTELLGLGYGVIDAGYKTIQLFVLEWGGDDRIVPTTLEVARFAAPLVSGLAAAKALAVIFRVELERLWVRLAGRNHVVVCGLGSSGWNLSAALRSAGWRVAAIDLVEPDRPATNWALIIGDATDPDTLLRAAAHRARHIVTLCGDDATNIAVALAAHDVGPAESTIHVLTTEPDLAALLRTETYRTHQDPAPSFEFFTLEDRGARLLLDHLATPPERVFIAGSSLLADRVGIEATRRWPAIQIERTSRLVNPEATTGLIGIRSLILVADDGSIEGLTTSLRLVQHLKEASFGAGGGTCDIFALSEQSRNLGDLISPTHGPNSAIRLHAFDLQETVLTAELLEGGTRESIARALHDAYRLTAARDASRLPPWEELDETSREASREAADGVGALFQAVGCDLVVAQPDAADPLALLPSEVELMAMLEHDRWLRWTAERARSGDSRLQSAWIDLPADAQHRTEAVIRRLPEVLRDIGQRVVRLDRSPARDLHSAYVERRLERGESVATNPSLVPWDRLPQSLQDSNRDQVAHLRVKLRHIGFDLHDGSGPPVLFTREQIEQLSELEHERWVRHRQHDGWVLGTTKDSEKKLTPHLVPWSDLDEATRETDREFVRAIPDIAASLEMHIAPA
jgi:hypothetical protein